MSSSGKRVGMWLNTSSKGTTYLGGKDPETNTRFMLFKAEDGTRRLCVKPIDNNDAPLETVATLNKAVTKSGEEFYASPTHSLFTNGFKEEGSKQPDFNLIINEG